MTRPKSARKAAKNASRDCRDLPLLRRVWAKLTPKYALELMLLDYGAVVYPFQISWQPHEPTAAEMLGPLKDEVAEFMEMMITLEGDAP